MFSYRDSVHGLSFRTGTASTQAQRDTLSSPPGTGGVARSAGVVAHKLSSSTDRPSCAVGAAVPPVPGGEPRVLVSHGIPGAACVAAAGHCPGLEIDTDRLHVTEASPSRQHLDLMSHRFQFLDRFR